MASMRPPMIVVAIRLSRTSRKFFKAAMDFRLGRDNATAESIQLADASMVTQPMNGQHINFYQTLTQSFSRLE
jgi:hypothetical protein